jgi:pimeloyl-ACP methyl ester carboxylesterase
MDDVRLIHVGERVLRARSLGAGTPVVYAHGAGGSILEQPVPDAVASQLGVRLVLIERPGLGASTRHEGRSLATWVDDMRAVLDALSLRRVRVLGWAAGVPYALAAAALAPDRVASLSLVGPWFGGEAREVDPSSPSAVAACREELGRIVAPLIQLLGRSRSRTSRATSRSGAATQTFEPRRAFACYRATCRARGRWCSRVLGTTLSSPMAKRSSPRSRPAGPEAATEHRLRGPSDRGAHQALVASLERTLERTLSELGRLEERRRKLEALLAEVRAAPPGKGLKDRVRSAWRRVDGPRRFPV